jgi:hypothetical protein
MKEQKILSARDDLITSGKIYYLIMELLIILPHPSVFTEGITVESIDTYDDIIIYYQLNDFLEIYILLRIYILIGVLLSLTEYATTRASRICRMIGVTPGYFYASKCLITESPL